MIRWSVRRRWLGPSCEVVPVWRGGIGEGGKREGKERRERYRFGIGEGGGKESSYSYCTSLCKSNIHTWYQYTHRPVVRCFDQFGISPGVLMVRIMVHRDVVDMSAFSAPFSRISERHGTRPTRSLSASRNRVCASLASGLFSSYQSGRHPGLSLQMLNTY